MAKCKCGEEFTKYTTVQNMCVGCAIKKAKAATKKKQKKAKEASKEFDKETKRRKKAQMSLREVASKVTQPAFNAFIRIRDHGLPCISCGAPWGYTVNAGHYFSAGANPSLRFTEVNCHNQCVRCNDQLSANIHNYRLGLIERYGQKYFDDLCQLKADLNLSKKSFTRDQLYEIRDEYKTKVKQIKKDKGL